mmetsp:Transcript_14333/g.40526  ORF Transcript_14333/g.40526 Transcript_14333/m.40526 type:complete len:106 (-) Transcript_14333:397-714(-)|eukprot:CAMPEP_0117667118 /NCGR_PEP_ID=MMETSP0804-20121206/10776_1 /TAXON_ID=1074897 /ORGANISM="Tetraselmis astigmatica, Strain CCMP880" /LENGTH=105 /DNA_ID=CAMNT_0005474783 /DNA_START=138 /DNA_END=455 /DNA_ORIENTATION=-
MAGKTLAPAFLACLLISSALVAVQGRVIPQGGDAAGHLPVVQLERRHLTVIPQGGVALKKFEETTKMNGEGGEEGFDQAADEDEDEEAEYVEGDAAEPEGEEDVY